MRSLLSFVLLVASCESGIVEGEHPAQVLVMPQDLTTGLSALDATITFAGYESTFANQIAPFSAGIMAMRVADGAAVPVSVSMTMSPDGLRTALKITATAPQPEGWYRLQLPKLPTPTVLSQPTQFFMDGGALVVRLRIGSQPLLRGFQACLAESKDLRVEVGFSEAVKATAQDPLSVSTGTAAGAMSCRRTDSFTVPAFLWDYTCSFDASVEVVTATVLPGGLASASGIPVAPATETETLSTGALTNATPCAVFKRVL